MADEILILKLKLDAEASIKTTDDLINRNKELAKLLRSAPKEGEEGFDQLEDSLERTREEYARNRQEILKFNRSLRETEEASDSMVGLSRKLRDLEKEYKSLTKEQRKTFGAELGANIKATREELSELEEQLGDYRRSVGDYPQQTTSAFGGLGNLIKGVGVAAAASLTFDAAIEGAKKIGEITKEFQTLRGEIQNVTGASGDDLDDFTVQLSTIAKTFGADTEQVLQAANSLTQNLTGDFGESLSKIKDGFLSGADANGEFLDSLIEYPAVIADAGINADQFIRVISQSAKSGIFSDKGIDAVKEGFLSLREGSQATQDAVIGLLGAAEGKELLKGVKTGEIPITDALSKISGKLNEIDPSSEAAGKAVADIFKGAGEDSGSGLFKILGNLDGEISSLIDTTNELTRSQIKQFNSEELLNESKNETSKRFASLTDGTNVLSNALQTLLFQYINRVFDALSPLGEQILSIGSRFTQFAERIGLVTNQGEFFDIIIDALTFNLRAFSFAISKSIDTVGFLVDGLIYAYDNFDLVRGIVDNNVKVFGFLTKTMGNIPATISGVSSATMALGDNLVNFFKRSLLEGEIFAKNIEKTFTLRGTARRRLEGEIESLRAEQSNLKEAGKSIGEAFNQGFAEAVQEVEVAEAIEDSVEKTDVDNSGKKVGKKFQKAFTDSVDGKKAGTKLAESIPGALDEVIESGSVEALRKKASELSSELDKLNEESDQFQVVAEKIKKANELLSAAEEAKKESTLSTEEILKRQSDLAKKSADEAKKAADEKLRIERERIDKELAEDIRAEQIKRDKRISEEGKTADDRKKILEEYNSEIQSLEIDAEKERLNLLEDGTTERLKLEAAIADEELAIRAELYEKDFDKAKEAEEKKKELREQFVELAFDAAQMLADGAFEIASINAENEKEEKLQKLDEETERKLETANGNAELEKQIETEAAAARAKIEKEDAKRRKKQALIQAVVNGALAATAALANTVLPFPLSLTALIPVAITTALQIATIKKQKFGRGRSPGKGQIVGGDLHINGGTDAVIIDGSNSQPVEIERDEALINRISTMRNTQLLSDVNQDGGGIRFPGTKKLTEKRRRRLRMFDMITEENPIIAERGLSPRMPVTRRKYQDGGIAEIDNPNSTSATLRSFSDSDFRRLEKAAEMGTKKGIENANLYERFKRQLEREDEIDERSEV